MTSSFSNKQLRAMTWWMPKSRDKGFDALVCDGAVRSGKTLAMGLGFFLWAMSCFSGRRFALCGKTRGGVRRNVVEELLPWLRKLGMTVLDSRTAQVLTVRFGRQENEFYLLGGKDEARRAHSGHDAGRRVSRRSRFDAAVVCRAGVRAVLGGGEQAVVQLQSGGAAALVLQGVDLAGGQAELPAPAFYDAG